MPQLTIDMLGRMFTAKEDITMWWIKDIIVDCILFAGSIYGFIAVTNILL